MVRQVYVPWTRPFDIGTTWSLYLSKESALSSITLTISGAHGMDFCEAYLRVGGLTETRDQEARVAYEAGLSEVVNSQNTRCCGRCSRSQLV